MDDLDFGDCGHRRSETKASNIHKLRKMAYVGLPFRCCLLTNMCPDHDWNKASSWRVGDLVEWTNPSISQGSLYLLKSLLARNPCTRRMGALWPRFNPERQLGSRIHSEAKRNREKVTAFSSKDRGEIKNLAEKYSYLKKLEELLEH